MLVSDKVYCDSYYCPDHYKLVDNADDVYCKDKKCTKDQCCKKGEEYPKHTLREVDDDATCHKLEFKNIYFAGDPSGSQRYAQENVFCGLLSTSNTDSSHLNHC